MGLPSTQPGSVQRAVEVPDIKPPDERLQQNDISALAYALWQKRGCPQGTHEQDWMEAERILADK